MNSLGFMFFSVLYNKLGRGREVGRERSREGGRESEGGGRDAAPTQ